MSLLHLKLVPDVPSSLAYCSHPTGSLTTPPRPRRRTTTAPSLRHTSPKDQRWRLCRAAPAWPAQHPQLRCEWQSVVKEGCEGRGMDYVTCSTPTALLKVLGHGGAGFGICLAPRHVPSGRQVQGSGPRLCHDLQATAYPAPGTLQVQCSSWCCPSLPFFPQTFKHLLNPSALNSCRAGGTLPGQARRTPQAARWLACTTRRTRPLMHQRPRRPSTDLTRLDVVTCYG